MTDPDYSARLAWARQHDPQLADEVLDGMEAVAEEEGEHYKAEYQAGLAALLSTLDQRYREAHAGPPGRWGHAELVAEVAKLTAWRDDLLRMAGGEDIHPEARVFSVVGLLQKAMNTFAEARAAHERTHALAPALSKACDELERYIGSDIPLTRETKAALPEWRRLAEGK